MWRRRFECGEGRFVYMWRFECGEGLSVEKGGLNVEKFE